MNHKKFWIALLLAASITQTYSQKIDLKSDIAVYDAVLKQSEWSAQKYRIYKIASTKELKYIEFSRIDISGVSRWQPADTVKGMKRFFDYADELNFKPHELKIQIGNYQFVDDLPEGTEEQNPGHHIIILSPVIYSKDRKFAVFTVEEIHGGMMAYFLVYIDNHWRQSNFKYLGGP